MSAPFTLPLKSITVDPSIQQRVEMDDALVAEYQTRIGTWIQTAPVVVFESCGVCWLADGFHRVCAADEAGLTEIDGIDGYDFWQEIAPPAARPRLSLVQGVRAR